MSDRRSHKWLCIICKNPCWNKSKTCSHSCDKEHKKQIYIQKWKQGVIPGHCKYGEVSLYIKEYLRTKYNNECGRCGWKEIHPVTYKVPIQVEHIDGNWMNCNEENLIMLCPNCHSLTPTYGALNKGYGRKQRYNPNGSLV